jgi:hypothetical protein
MVQLGFARVPAPEPHAAFAAAPAPAPALTPAPAPDHDPPAAGGVGACEVTLVKEEEAEETLG